MYIVACDLGSLSSVASAAAEIDRDIDLLILNAGVMACPYELTEDGFERQIGVNHIAHFALADALMKSQRPAMWMKRSYPSLKVPRPDSNSRSREESPCASASHPLELDSRCCSP